MLGILFQAKEGEGGGIDLSSKLPPISIKAEVLFDIPTPLGPLHFTNSMLYTLIVIAALVLFFALATRRLSTVPRGSQNFAEAIVEFLLSTTEGTAGRRVGRRIFPLIATLFLFIIVANWSGLLPGVGTIGGCYTAPEGEDHALVTNVKTAAPAQDLALAPPREEEHAEEGGGLPSPTGHECPEGTHFVPFLRAANADLNTTLGMAIIAVLVVQIAGIASHGVGGYLKELVTPIFLAPIHIMGEFSRIISLSFRLFGNIFGGEVLVTVMFVLLGSVFAGFGAFIFLGLEVLFGAIQALLFSILTLVFISSAVGGHGGGGGHGDEGHSSVHEVAAHPDKPGSGQRVPDDQVSDTSTHVGG
ncbi:MAG: F0F1 ATP synthase subunit A [Chloroflexota bacterium]|nr:F0F1 ATP synthase subunit A [Chloroflexota bacterium]